MHACAAVHCLHCQAARRVEPASWTGAPNIPQPEYLYRGFCLLTLSKLMVPLLVLYQPCQTLCNICCSSGDESPRQPTIMPMTLDLCPSGSLDERLWVTMEPEKAVQR